MNIRNYNKALDVRASMGASMVEYTLIMAIVLLIAMAGVASVGYGVNESFTRSLASFDDNPKSVGNSWSRSPYLPDGGDWVADPNDPGCFVRLLPKENTFQFFCEWESFGGGGW